MPLRIDYQLLDAAKSGDVAALNSLSVDLLNINVADDRPNSYGRQAIHLAAASGHIEALEWLIAHGADVNAKTNDGTTSIHIAAWCGHIHIMDCLAMHHADVNAKRYNGLMPIQAAAMNGQFRALEWLIPKVIQIGRIPDLTGNEDNQNTRDIIYRIVKKLLYEYAWNSKEHSLYINALNLLKLPPLSSSLAFAASSASSKDKETKKEYDGLKEFFRKQEEQAHTLISFDGDYSSDSSDSDDDYKCGSADFPGPSQELKRFLDNIKQDLKAELKKNLHTANQQVERNPSKKEAAKFRDIIEKAYIMTWAVHGSISYSDIKAGSVSATSFPAVESPHSDGKIKGHVAIDGKNFKPYVLLFRGVGYFMDRWNAPSRREHRKELFKQEIYSEAAFSPKQDLYHSYTSLNPLCREEKKGYNEALTKNSEKLTETLIDLRNSDPVVVEKESKKYSLYANFLDCMQYIYTNGIERFEKFIKEPPLKDILNSGNPFVSTSELPVHALRYAMGEKEPYTVYALPARYDIHGRPEKPYIGKLYVTLHPIDDFAKWNRPNIIREASEKRFVTTGSIIGSELEVSFLGRIPMERFVYSQKIRVPGFHRKEYPKHYEAKYGIDNDLYVYIQKQNKDYYILKYGQTIQYLRYYIRMYHAVRLMLWQFEEAKKDGRVILFLNELGGLTTHIPQWSVSEADKGDLSTEKMRCFPPLIDAKRGIVYSSPLKVFMIPPEVFFSPESPASVSSQEKIKEARASAFGGSPPKQTYDASYIKAKKYNFEEAQGLARDLYDAFEDDVTASMAALILDDTNHASAQAEHTISSLGTTTIAQKTIGLELEDVSEDGNCFFHAVEKQLAKISPKGKSSMYISELRQFAINYVRDHIGDFKDFMIEESAEQYIARMEKAREWVDHVLIKAMALELKINIVILEPAIQGTLKEPIIIRPDDTAFARTIFIYHIPELHYQSIVSIDVRSIEFVVVKLHERGIEIPEEFVHGEALCEASLGPAALTPYTASSSSSSSSYSSSASQSGPSSSSLFDTPPASLSDSGLKGKGGGDIVEGVSPGEMVAALAAEGLQCPIKFSNYATLSYTILNLADKALIDVVGGESAHWVVGARTEAGKPLLIWPGEMPTAIFASASEAGILVVPVHQEPGKCAGAALHVLGIMEAAGKTTDVPLLSRPMQQEPNLIEYSNSESALILHTDEAKPGGSHTFHETVGWANYFQSGLSKTTFGFTYANCIINLARTFEEPTFANAQENAVSLLRLYSMYSGFNLFSVGASFISAGDAWYEGGLLSGLYSLSTSVAYMALPTILLASAAPWMSLTYLTAIATLTGYHLAVNAYSYFSTLQDKGRALKSYIAWGDDSKWLADKTGLKIFKDSAEKYYLISNDLKSDIDAKNIQEKLIAEQGEFGLKLYQYIYFPLIKEKHDLQAQVIEGLITKEESEAQEKAQTVSIKTDAIKYDLCRVDAKTEDGRSYYCADSISSTMYKVEVAGDALKATVI